MAIPIFAGAALIARYGPRIYRAGKRIRTARKAAAAGSLIMTSKTVPKKEEAGPVGAKARKNQAGRKPATKLTGKLTGAGTYKKLLGKMQKTPGKTIKSRLGKEELKKNPPGGHGRRKTEMLNKKDIEHKRKQDAFDRRQSQKYKEQNPPERAHKKTRKARRAQPAPYIERGHPFFDKIPRPWKPPPKNW
jgi:hypothetical protein